MEKEYFPEFVQEQFTKEVVTAEEDSDTCYGTFVHRDVDGPSLSELVPEINDIVTEDWERNIMALEKGEWSNEMSSPAFKKYLKTRNKMPSFSMAKTMAQYKDQQNNNPNNVK